MKKNIAIVITRLDLGGAQQAALYLAEHLDRKKFNVHLIAGEGGYLDGAIKNSKLIIKNGSKSGLRTPDSGINLNLWPELVHPIDPFFDALALFRLMSYFKKNKIDIVNTHSSKAGILGRKAAWLAGVPKIVHTVHGFPFHKFQLPPAHWAYVAVEKLAALVTHRLVAVGNDVMEYGLKKWVGSREQYAVIRPGVDLAKFGVRSPGSGVKGEKFLKKYGLDPKLFTVGMIGNCKKQKNPLGFVEIARRVIRENPDTQFVFAGDGPLKDAAVLRAKELKLENKVKFTGWTGEPEEFLRSIDLFLLASLWEGMPCALAQAAAAGKPIVASDIGGNREFMEAARASRYLYDPKKPQDAAGLITGIIRTGGKKYRISPEKILKEFNFKYMLKEYEKTFLG